MAWFAFARLARAMITILVVVGFAFIVLRLSGDPALEILSNDAPPEARDAFRSAFGLDQPIWLQFFDYMTRVATGNLGNSMREGRDALSVVIERIPITLALSLPALLINVLIGIPAGILAALHRNSLLDRGVMLGAVAGFTIPSFVLGLLLVLVFSVQLGCLPSGGHAAGITRSSLSSPWALAARPFWRVIPVAPCWKSSASPISAPHTSRACRGA